MSAGNAENFPWGLNDPTRKQRIFVALTIGIGATLALFLRLAYRPDPVDFDLAWFGARMLWAGRDPYPLAGPNGLFHWNYHLLYPAPALVAAMPLALLAKRPAAYAFTFISAALLGFGITRGSWHRLPILASAAFVDTTLGGQWSSILVAAIFLPTLAAIACVKPQLGLAALVGASSRRAITAALLGTLLLGAISFALVPSWFGEWLALVRDAGHMKAALFQPGGFLIAFVLIKWKRPEAWAVFIVAALPQTLMWYSFLILLAFPATYRESCILSLTSSLGYLGYHLVLNYLPPSTATEEIIWILVIGTTYLPAVIAILKRPNRGMVLAWTTPRPRDLQGIS